MLLEAPAVREGAALRSTIFHDIYYSAESGLDEARQVFLAGNGLPHRWRGHACDCFAVGELGFGSGLNWLALRMLMEEEHKMGHPVPYLVYATVEKYPLDIEEIFAAAEIWPEALPYLRELAARYKPREGLSRWDFPWGEFWFLHDDVSEISHHWPGPSDAWFLDGFAPAKNPEMWTPALLATVGRLTVKGGTAASFTSAGAVKQGLRDAGFEVVRKKGFGAKHHRIEAVKL